MKDFYLSSKIVMLCNSFPDTSLGGYWQLLNLLWRRPCRVMSIYWSKMHDIPPPPKKKCSENCIEYFTHSKNEMAKCLDTQKLFSHFQILRCSKIKKNVLHSKPFIKIIGILLLISRFVKSWDQTIIQIIRKNKSLLMFLINNNNFFVETYLKPSHHLRWSSAWHYFEAFSHQIMS